MTAHHSVILQCHHIRYRTSNLRNDPWQLNRTLTIVTDKNQLSNAKITLLSMLVMIGLHALLLTLDLNTKVKLQEIQLRPQRSAEQKFSW